MSDLKTTPLNQWHRNHGAKMAPFAGWDMPIQYSGIIDEHMHTREHAALFDICHMGEFLIRGEQAREGLSGVLTHNLETLAPGKCRYGFLPDEKGCVIDDLIVYCMAPDEYMLVVNGARVDADFSWLRTHLPDSVSMEDISMQTAKIDLQGPKSIDVLEQLLGKGFRDLGYFNFREESFRGEKLLVSRTGYTGELGYELYLPWDLAPALWESLVSHELVKPAGLGARDTLRLEMGLPLYGQDLDLEHTPAEAGFTPMLKSPAEYIGKEHIMDVKNLLVPLALEGRRAARHGDPVLLESGEEVGEVTSGSFAPSLGHAIALAYVRAEHAENETFAIRCSRSTLPARRASLPFYTQATARTRLS